MYFNYQQKNMSNQKPIVKVRKTRVIGKQFNTTSLVVFSGLGTLTSA